MAATTFGALAYAKFCRFLAPVLLSSLAVFTDTSHTPSIHLVSRVVLAAPHRDARFAIQRILVRPLARSGARMKSAREALRGSFYAMRNAETRRRALARGRRHIMNNNRVQRRTLWLRSLRRPCLLRVPCLSHPLCVRDLSVPFSQFLPPLPVLILARFF